MLISLASAPLGGERSERVSGKNNVPGGAGHCGNSTPLLAPGDRASPRCTGNCSARVAAFLAAERVVAAHVLGHLHLDHAEAGEGLGSGNVWHGMKMVSDTIFTQTGAETPSPE